jgi:peptidoglycan hydrolase CwlO-like protein
LFGWSEKKAAERQAELEGTLSQEQEAAQRQEQGEAGLRREMRLNAGDLEEQQAEISQLLANAEALEREAPTPATASHARRLRRAIDAVRQNEALPVEERWRLLRRYSEEVDLMRAEVAGPDAPGGR